MGVKRGSGGGINRPPQERTRTMTYFTLYTHRDEKIGHTAYFKQELAVTAAKRLAGKWRKNNEKRGNGIKIVKNDDSIYSETVEWVFSA
jgi:hypothetical protein